jgi:hypothetical protein
MRRDADLGEAQLGAAVHFVQVEGRDPESAWCFAVSISVS